MFLNVKNKQKKRGCRKKCNDLYIFVCFVKIDSVNSKAHLWETGSFLLICRIFKMNSIV